MKKELGDKVDKITSQISAQEKAMSEKISKQITDSQKSIQEKLTAQEKGTKDLSDKIGKLQKIFSLVMN